MNWCERIVEALVNNWPLVFVAIWGICVAIDTLKAIKEQTDATRVAADAAKLNAQALINAERPWFVVEIEHWTDNPEYYRIKVTNRGRTPGILEEVFVEKCFIQNPSDLPLPPSYSNGCIGPDDNFFGPGRDPYIIAPPFNPTMELKDWRDSPNNSQTVLRVAYGKMTYRDTLSGNESSEIIHETRWCYYWLENGNQAKWVRCGPRDYTGHRDYTRKKT